MVVFECESGANEPLREDFFNKALSVKVFTIGCRARREMNRSYFSYLSGTGYEINVDEKAL